MHLDWELKTGGFLGLNGQATPSKEHVPGP